MPGDVPLPGWELSTFTADGHSRPVYRRGTGPGVVVMHEVHGITSLVRRFAEEVVDAGFTVAMPLLAGGIHRRGTLPSGLATLGRVCISREFSTWATNRTSPVVAWLRRLARTVHREAGGPGVGAVGMCLTGGFALGMTVDEVMLAPVLAQPSLPLPIGAARAGDLGLSPEDRAAVAARAATGCEVLGLRYRDDNWVGTRFESLRELLGDRFIAVELEPTVTKAHAVLTAHRDQASVERVISFLRTKLQT